MMQLVRNNTHRCALFVCLAGGLVLGGCRSPEPQDSIRGLSPQTADRLNVGRGGFESLDDPPFTADTHLAAGMLSEAHNAYAQAIEHYQIALEIEPGHLPAMYRLAVLHTRLGHFEQAIQVWNRYITASNRHPTGYSNLGYTYELAGRTAEAERAYRQAIARDGDHHAARVNYGLLLARDGRTDEAREQLSTVLPPAQVHYNLGSVHEQQGRLDLARAQYGKALELDPGFSAARSRLSHLQPR